MSREEYEQHLRMTEAGMEHYPGYFIVKDLDQKYIALNEGSAQILGYQSKEDCIGMSDYDIKTPAVELAECFVQQDLEVIERKKPVNIFQYSDFGNVSGAYMTIKSPFIYKGEMKGISCFLRSVDNSFIREIIKSVIQKDVRGYMGHQRRQFTYIVSEEEVTADEYTLTERQFECLFYYLRGYSAKNIGKCLGISYRTVESHLEAIKNKFGVDNKAQMIEIAVSLGYNEILPRRFLCNDRERRLL